MGNYYTGWTSFMPRPGTVDKKDCPVCGVGMKVKRNCNGPTSSIGAQFGQKTLHDWFYCEDSDSNWHIQAMKLMQEAEKTPSMDLQKIYEKEIARILKNKKATKKVSKHF
ncbi:hypothetical protein C4577_02100 [Candidatus Parcubacteria bacterium]|nr:MAG: hypothetical protein C4577_02100 [Candidatus Parcubacteria bacterium]